MIFLMSFWVIAQSAAKTVVIAPRHRHVDRAVWFVWSSGCIRISRKMPATTMVLECSRADTGVGPSIAAGSHGCRPNWADFPVAARMSPSVGRVGGLWGSVCRIFHVFRFMASQAIDSSNPMSPIRL